MTQRTVEVPVVLTINVGREIRSIPVLYTEAAKIDGGMIDRVGHSMANPFVFYLFKDGGNNGGFIATLNITPAIEKLAKEGIDAQEVRLPESP